MTVCRKRGTGSLELRSVMSLCSIWQLRGKSAAARQFLADTYSWFTEGFDTADLREAAS